MTFSKPSDYHQNLYDVYVKENFEFAISYLGWGGNQILSTPNKLSFDIKMNTITQFVRHIESLDICDGIETLMENKNEYLKIINDKEMATSKAHKVTKQAEAFVRGASEDIIVSYRCKCEMNNIHNMFVFFTQIRF